MSNDRVEGAIKRGVGHIQDAAGGLIGDNVMQARGKFNEGAGFLQDAFGQMKDHASDILGDASSQTNQALDQVKGRARSAVKTVQGRYDALQDLVIDNPLVAVAVAAGIGLAVGLALHGRARD
jgi:uncharacterized protein YjbJ (UPF0337 family)